MVKYLFILIFLSCSCSVELPNKPEELIDYPNTVGDIDFDSKLDNPNFQMCLDYNYSYQYYMLEGLGIDGELAFVKEKYKSLYSNPSIQGQSGFITIRFIINCKGESGRFRMYSLDEELNEFKFSNEISQQILKIIKEIRGWKIQSKSISGEDLNIDYYQYLTFHIKNGKLINIAP